MKFPTLKKLNTYLVTSEFDIVSPAILSVQFSNEVGRLRLLHNKTIDLKFL